MNKFIIVFNVKKVLITTNCEINYISAAEISQPKLN